ncbi:MAG: Gfo/Idh/MocA family oxidoreductase [Candidatus Aenigmarchaeota archaeon]|nr:Gfo/Idh/MocA family oxidoreductase [Candidatus Aenigmarchaeota archaeon]
MIKVGLIGTGKWGENHLRVFSELENCELIGVADVDPEKEKMAKEFNTGFFTDYKELLSLVDAVSIVVPTHIHYKIAKDCLLEGKHVFIEKPITLDPEEAKELVDLAKEKNLILAVGHLFRYNPAVLKLKELLEDAGDIHYTTMRYIHSSKPPRKDMGVVFNFGSHLIDTMNFLFGKPKRVFCKKINYLSEEREDYANITLGYDSFAANLEVSWLHPLKKRDMWIIASNKKIYIDFLEQKIVVHPIKISYDKNEFSEPIEIEIKKNEPLKDELKSFCESVESGNEPINSGKVGFEAVRICDFCLKSADSGKEMEI